MGVLLHQRHIGRQPFGDVFQYAAAMLSPVRSNRRSIRMDQFAELLDRRDRRHKPGVDRQDRAGERFVTVQHGPPIGRFKGPQVVANDAPHGPERFDQVDQSVARAAGSASRPTARSTAPS